MNTNGNACFRPGTFEPTGHAGLKRNVANEYATNVVLEQRPDGVDKRDDVESVEAWRADQILTDLLELPTTRSPEVARKIERLQELSRRRSNLSPEQKKEYEQLSLWAENLPPAIEDPLERRRAEVLQARVDNLADRVRELE